MPAWLVPWLRAFREADEKILLMNWSHSLFVGLVTAVVGVLYGFLAGLALAEWLRVSTFEGEFGYFVVQSALFSLLLSFVWGVVLSRFFAGSVGLLSVTGWSVLSACGVVTLLAGLVWFVADREPLVDGRALDLEVELSVPAHLQRSPQEHRGPLLVVLSSGGSTRTGSLHTGAERVEGNRWIIPGFVPFHSRADKHRIGVVLQSVPAQYFELPLPSVPQPMPDWSDWLSNPTLHDGTAPRPEAAFFLRFRVVMRREGQ